MDPDLVEQTRTENEVQDALEDVLGILDLEKLLERAVEACRQGLVAERQRMRGQMEQQKSSQPVEWLEGIDDLAPSGFDLLTGTVLLSAIREMCYTMRHEIIALEYVLCHKL